MVSNSRTRSRLRAALVGAAFAAVFIVTGCAAGPAGPSSSSAPTDASNWDSVVAAANKEGHLTIYTNYNTTVIPQIQAAFNKVYPDITLEMLHIPSATQGQQRVQAEVTSGQGVVDVYVHSDFKFIADNPTYFSKIIGPNTQTDTGKKVLSPDGTYLETNFIPYGYGWNTQLVSGTPTLTQLLNDPSYKGRVALVDWNADHTFALALLEQEDQYIKDTGDHDFMTKLAALDPTYFSSATPLAQAVASGQMAWSPTIAPGFIPSGTPVKFGFLSLAPAGTQLVTVVSSAPDPNAAQVYANWILTPEAQQIVAANEASAVPNTPGALLSADQTRLINTADPQYDDAYFTTELARLHQVFGR